MTALLFVTCHHADPTLWPRTVGLVALFAATAYVIGAVMRRRR